MRRVLPLLLLIVAAPAGALEPDEMAERCLAAAAEPDGMPRCMAEIARDCAPEAAPGGPVSSEDALCRIAHANRISEEVEDVLTRSVPMILPQVYDTIDEACAASVFPEASGQELQMKVAGCASAYWLGAYAFFQNEIPQ